MLNMTKTMGSGVFLSIMTTIARMPSFQCFSDFYAFYHSFFRRSWAFFHRYGKKQKKLGEFFKNFSFDRLINTIDSVCTDGSMAIGQRRLL
jgi:hypothetical protein